MIIRKGIDKESMTLLTWKSIRVKYKSPDMAKYFTPPQDLNTQVLMVYGDDDNIVAQ